VADFVPKDEIGRVEWLKHFAGWMSAHGAGYGFPAAEIAELNADAGAADTAFQDCEVAQAAAHAAVQRKKKGIADGLRRARRIVRLLQPNLAMTDAARADAKITVPDRIPTPMNPDAIREMDTPICVLDHSMPGQVTIHYGPNPHNERENGRPEGTLGAYIQYHRGGLPEHEDGWHILLLVTESPWIHVVHEDTAINHAYRVCWADKRGNNGPYSAPAVCTVSV